MSIELETLPLSPMARQWLDQQPDRQGALVDLATHGDDYELVATGLSAPEDFTLIGAVTEGEGVEVRFNGAPVSITRTGWRHGKDG
jgi:thiamine monophosphate kinase